VPTAHLNGVDVYFERDGNGPRLLFLNGSGATIETSALLIAPFRDRFSVLVHDQRGLGRSEIPPGPYSMADYAADAVALLDHVGWPTARIVGVSFGGMVAQELAVTWPARVERLALVCTSAGGGAGSSYPLHELADRTESERAEVGRRILDTRFDAAWLAEHPSDRALADAMASRRSAPKSPEQLRGEREQLLARSLHDVASRLDALTCPTLVAGGRYDGIAPPANSEAIAAGIPGAELRLYEGGHAFFAQDRAALPDILRFLAAS
jgi:pimeloyl-ACP methyl ester carboxylesterase